MLGMSACRDDDPDPMGDRLQLSISSPSILEGDNGTNNLIFEITLSGPNPSQTPITVAYRTLDGSAIGGLDFDGTNGTVTFSDSQTQKNISINIITDVLKESDESFFVQLFDASENTLITNMIGEGKIRNDDTDIEFAADGYLTPDQYPGFDLTWSDEFDSSTIATDNWAFEIGDGCPDLCGWGNNELEFYTDRPENLELANGLLKIRAANDNWQNHPYTSARITSKDKQAFQFGRIDIRAKLPTGKGLWPCFWMLGENIDEVSWPACGEIDLMELSGHQPFAVHGTAHFGDPFPNNRFIGTSYSLENDEAFAEKFHVFTIMWVADAIYWYVDDQLFHEIHPADLEEAAYPFNQAFFFTINLAIGGNWPGDPDASTVFPQEMQIDYIRVFQRS